MSFGIEVVRTDDRAVLCCRGRLVLEHGAPVLRDTARRELSTARSLALDLGSVTQIDARGIGVLAELCAAARDAGSIIVLASAERRVRHLLRLARLDESIPVDSAVSLA